MKKISYETYLDKIYGCFVGKAISGNIGAPHEGVKMPMDLKFESYMIDETQPNDDLDLQVLWLDVVEKKGADFTAFDLLKRFVENCDYSPGEYAIMRKNYMRGIYPPYSGKFSNDYYIEGMGCPIRSEIWACIAAGNMHLASEFSYRDGCIDHYGESINAEKFLAALESEAFFDSDVFNLISKALSVVPKDSKFRELVEYTVEACEKYKDIKKVLSKILFKYGHPDCTNMYQNMGITIASLIFGDCDIIKSSIMALNCGFDTDCTCATVGAIIGIIKGADVLKKAYGLESVSYVLGVTSQRRSNSIFDLAEDIAKVGVSFAENENKCLCISDAPFERMEFEPKPSFEFFAEYEDMKPYIELGGKRNVILHIKNNQNVEKRFSVSAKAPNGIEVKCADSVTIAGMSEEKILMEFYLPEDADVVYDTNMIDVTLSDGDTTQNYSFGLSGVSLWKMSGPFWVTEPECNTELLLSHITDRRPYKALMENSLTEGNFFDKMRQFHLNFKVEKDKEFVSEYELFESVNEDHPLYEQTLIQTPEDSIEVSDFLGFKGPCVVYLSKVIISDEDKDVFIQVGHSTPFKLYLNGELLAKRDYCDNFTAENVHIENVKLKKGENKLYMRLTKINSDTKFCTVISKGISMSEHIVDLGCKNPYKF